MNDRATVEREIAGHLQDALCVPGPVEPDTNLIANGALDSLMMIDLIRFVEETYAIRIAPQEISPQHFQSVSALTTLIMSKMPENSSVAVAS